MTHGGSDFRLNKTAYLIKADIYIFYCKKWISVYKIKKPLKSAADFICGRGDGIRTHGLFVPNEALYQTEPHLENH